jgi:peptide chain release factor 2
LAPDFWSNHANATKITSEITDIQSQLDDVKKLDKASNDIADSLALLKEEKDASFQAETEDKINKFSKDLEGFENLMYLSGPYDNHAAILDFHPGAGGTEAHDWANMLLRMYMRFAERHKFKAEVVDLIEGEEAGISSATVIISGKNAYGMLKSENGVHRLVRISPFDASKSRHTSFASVNVMPQFDSSIQLDIDEKDLKIDTYRSSGAGGQNVNKTESAVRITHIPSGIVVTCQVERDQLANKEMAMNLLKSRLFARMEAEREEKLNKIGGEKKDIQFGSQIRSYVFCPYTLVKDHRTDYEETDVEAVMDGSLDGFIKAYLRKAFQDERKL